MRGKEYPTDTLKGNVVFGNRIIDRTAEQLTAAAIDGDLEKLASNAQRHGISDARWNKLALALLGVRQFSRPLMHDDDRRTHHDRRK